MLAPATPAPTITICARVCIGTSAFRLGRRGVGEQPTVIGARRVAQQPVEVLVA